MGERLEHLLIFLVSQTMGRRAFADCSLRHRPHNLTARDLKPENILLVGRENDVDVKITDFGLAKRANKEGLKTFCGTPQYFAPEVLMRRHTVLGVGRYGMEADMWSVGEGGGLAGESVGRGLRSREGSRGSLPQEIFLPFFLRYVLLFCACYYLLV